MTPKEAIEQSILIWDWVSKHDDGKSNIKADAVKALGLPDFEHYCPCCEYTKYYVNDDRVDCDHCPMKGYWVKDEDGDYIAESRCTNDHSPYGIWTIAYNPEICRGYAHQIVEQLKDCLKDKYNES